MLIPIVNELDEVVGTKDRSNLDYTKDIFRSASLWITNKDGDVLLTQRSLDKKVNPGKWAEAVGGVVEGKDSYETTVLREAQEELGLSNVQIHTGPKQFINSPAKYFVQWYTAEIDKPADEFVLQTDEVSRVAWIQKDKLKQQITENSDKFIPAMNEICDLFI